MKIKKIFAALAAAVMTLAFMPAALSAADDEPTASGGAPYFILTQNQSYEVIAGQENYLHVSVKNMSEYDAASTSITIIDEKGNLGLMGHNVYTGGTFSSKGVKVLTIGLDVPASTLSGSYALKLNIDAMDSAGTIMTQSLSVDVKVKSDVVRNALSVSGYTVDKTDIKSGDAFNITVKVKNNSGVAIKNGRVELTGLDGTKFAMNTGVPYVVSDFARDEEKSFSFSVIACGGIASIREPVSVECTYYMNSSDEDTLQKSTGTVIVPCAKGAGDSADKTFAPNIIIQNYNFGGDYAVGGKVFPLSFTIKNTSSETAIKNLKVTVSGAAGSGENGVAFSPANSSNSFFFDSLGTGGTREIALDMLTRADAKPDSYPIQISFSYEYTANGTTAQATDVTETITIPVQQDDRFTVNSVDVQPDCYVGQEATVNVTFVNKGKSQIYNLEAELQGEGFTCSQPKLYIGNVQSGSEEYYDATFTPDAEGEIKGKIIVRYEDSNGNEKEITQEFTTFASQMNYDDPSMNGDMNGDMGGDIPVDADVSAGFPVWAIILICAGGAAVVTVAVIIIVKTVKKKKALKEDGDDDEDI